MPMELSTKKSLVLWKFTFVPGQTETGILSAFTYPQIHPAGDPELARHPRICVVLLIFPS